ncbi:hypothetical protein Taro_037728, partial [Colocasia esculenta]|nr:hypothetical protein [Colocasia esculenta]
MFGGATGLVATIKPTPGTVRDLSPELSYLLGRSRGFDHRSIGSCFDGGSVITGRKGLVTRVRARLMRPRSPTVEVLVLLATGLGPHLGMVRAAQKAVNLTNVVLVDAWGLLVSNDFVHLTTEAQVLLGEKLAAAYTRISHISFCWLLLLTRRLTPQGGIAPCATALSLAGLLTDEVAVDRSSIRVRSCSLVFRPPDPSSDALSGQHFKRWQQRMKIWFTMIGLITVIESDPPKVIVGDSASAAKAKEWKKKDRLGHGYILTALSDVLFDVYSSSTFLTSKALWDELDQKYNIEDQGLEKYSIGKFLKFHMLEDRSVAEQAHEFLLMIH